MILPGKGESGITDKEKTQAESFEKPLVGHMGEPGPARGRRTGKDTVFTHLFSEPKYRFQLFQALHPEMTDITADDIIPLTITNVLLDKPYNDLGLLAGDRLLILVEAQSTWSVNILIRFLMYVARTYLDLINARKLNLYGTKALPLPEPELYVIYTGEREREREVMDIMLTLFDQETATRNFMAEVAREARVDERQKTTLTVNLETIRSLMKTLKLSPAEAMNAMEIPPDQQAVYAEQL